MIYYRLIYCFNLDFIIFIYKLDYLLILSLTYREYLQLNRVILHVNIL
jgi:hypothetical protein